LDEGGARGGAGAGEGDGSVADLGDGPRARQRDSGLDAAAAEGVSGRSDGSNYGFFDPFQVDHFYFLAESYNIASQINISVAIQLSLS